MKKTQEKPAPEKASGEEDQSFPGYPQYPATEDIVYRAKRVDMDLDADEELADAPTDETFQPPATGALPKTAHSPSDVTREDLQALNAEENTFVGDDEVLEDRVYPVDFTGKDLDVPSQELDDREGTRGDEDEENNLYSLGGENHEDLEEDRS